MEKHYVVIWGDHGYLPDGVESFDDKIDAIGAIVDTFNDLPDDQVTNMKTDLDINGFHDFDDRALSGIDYVEIEECFCLHPEDHNDSF